MNITLPAITRLATLLLALTTLFALHKPARADGPAANPAPDTLHCIRANSTGSGKSWDDALPQLPDKLQRGHTYYIAAGAYPAHRFADPVDGEKIITIKKATEADHGPDAGWKKEFAAPAQLKPLAFYTSYYTVDGQTGGGPDNFTSGHGFEINIPEHDTALRLLDGNAKKGDHVSHITLRHIAAGAASIDVKATAVYGCNAAYSDITISHCYFHDMFGAPIMMINWDRVLVEYTCVARNKCTPEWHSEAVSSRACNHVTFRYNWFENIQGTGIIMHMSGDAADWEIYGNIFYDNGQKPAGDTAHGVFADNQNGSIKRVKIYNNTIVGINGLCSGFRFFNAAGDIEAVNNLWYKCPARAILLGTTTQDYNTFIETPIMGDSGPHDMGPKDLNPFANAAKADFRLTQHTDPGKPLPAPYDKDMFGNPYAVDTHCDRGAVAVPPKSPAAKP